MKKVIFVCQIAIESIFLLLFSDLFLFFLSYKASKLSNFSMFIFVKIVSVSFTISNLKEIIIECLFDDSYLSCSFVELIMDNFTGLAGKSSVEFTPEGNFLYDLSNRFLFLFAAFFVIVIFIVWLSKFF
jgi:hypothetical protein